MPNPADLVRQARLRANLSQRELAKRAGTTQSVVARIERGQTSPTWETLERLLAAAGETLSPQTQPADGSMLYEVPGLLRMTPEERLRVVEGLSDFRYRARRVSDGGRVPGATIPLNIELLFTTLGRHRVQFVLIGALGARLHGFARSGPRSTDSRASHGMPTSPQSGVPKTSNAWLPRCASSTRASSPIASLMACASTASRRRSHAPTSGI